MTHDESIALIKSLGAKFTPELKAPKCRCRSTATTPRRNTRSRCSTAYKKAGFRRSEVFAQSFNLADVLYWMKTEPEFAAQAVYLEDRYEKPGLTHKPETWKPSMAELKAQGVKILAPPIWTMLTLNGKRKSCRPNTPRPRKPPAST